MVEEAVLRDSSNQGNEHQKAYANKALFIKDAWTKSKVVFLKFTLLFLLEHLIFLAPLVDLKLATRRR